MWIVLFLVAIVFLLSKCRVLTGQQRGCFLFVRNHRVFEFNGDSLHVNSRVVNCWTLDGHWKDKRCWALKTALKPANSGALLWK